MSGTNGTRDETPSTGVGDPDPCQKKRRGPINSPKAPVLSKLAVGAVLDVNVQLSGTIPILIVASGGQNAGSLTFVGYLEIIDCIQNRGVKYKATIISISGGVYEVRVEPR